MAKQIYPNKSNYFTPAQLGDIPLQSGVYMYFDAQHQLLYIGKAKCLQKRVKSYFQKQEHSERIAQMIGQIVYIDITITQTETEALILENHLIRSKQPKYNIIFKDDKSYPFLKISKHAFPRLSVFRSKGTHANDSLNQENTVQITEHTIQTKNNQANITQNQFHKSISYLFGPYPNSQSVYASIELLQKIFKLRTCEDTVFASRSKPCLLYQIKRCSGPCLNLNPSYEQDVGQAIAFLKGKQKDVMQSIETQMYSASESMQFEKAAELRDQLQALNDLFKQQNVVIHKNWDVDVLAIAQKGASFALVVAMIRQGRHLGYQRYQYTLKQSKPNKLNKNYPLNTLENLENLENPENIDLIEAQPTEHIEDAQELIQAYLTHSYTLKTGKNYIVLPEFLVSKTLWQEWQVFMPKFKYLNPNTDFAKSWLESAQENAQLDLMKYLNQTQQVDQQLIALKQLLPKLNLTQSNVHIECFDISHTSGEHTKASCVVFFDKALQKKDYRHFNLDNLESKGDDYAAMEQAIVKRYKNMLPEHMPHLILIDGGIGQVHAAMKGLEACNLQAYIPNLLGIRKGEKRKVGLETLVYSTGEEISPNYYDLGLLLLANIRDSAHDYAVAKMRHKRSNALKHSVLDDVEGIGAVKRKRLISHFGGLQGLQQATVQELMQVPGISMLLAEKIKETIG